MRTITALATLGFVLFSAEIASAAQSHYLEVTAKDQGNTITHVGPPPDLTPKVATEYKLGATMDPAIAENQASVDSNIGEFKIDAKAQQLAGTTTLTPKLWVPMARMDEEIKPGTPAAKGVTISLEWGFGGNFIQTTPGKISMHASLRIDDCSLYVTKSIVTDGAPAVPDDLINACDDTPGFTATLNPGDMSVTIADMGASKFIEVQFDVEYGYGGDFAGSLDTHVKGKLSMQGIGGNVVGTTPTFLTAATAPDGGTTSSSSGGATSSSSGGSSGTASSSGGAASSSGGSSAAPSGDDGGCHASSSGLGGLAPAIGALVALAVARRRRRA